MALEDVLSRATFKGTRTVARLSLDTHDSDRTTRDTRDGVAAL
jgi:hypothetical protein